MFDRSPQGLRHLPVARRLQIEFPSDRHHIMHRANERRAMFIDDHEYGRFVEVLTAGGPLRGEH